MEFLVIGESFIDRYWIGSPRCLSAEAPIPVIDIKTTLEFPGGAANVLENLKSLGISSWTFLTQPSAKPIKNRLMVDTHQVARWDENDVAGPITEEQLACIPQGYDGIIISDYGKGALGGDIRRLKALVPQDVPLFIDTKRDPFWFTPIANTKTFYFPNLKEYTQFQESYLELEGQVVLKRGPKGLQFGTLRVPALAKQVLSVNGAGDTVIAAFALAYSQTSSAEAALHFAAQAAALAVEAPYTTAVSLKDIHARFEYFRGLPAGQ